ncbi:hypothetical protein [Lysinibacillus sp. NPDC056185]|uniref:hypothetical protein n=1 Tax=Lysinibacillus sp. NPDC056185 TaxID=3345739 RepID=UPI0039EFA1B4
MSKQQNSYGSRTPFYMNEALQKKVTQPKDESLTTCIFEADTFIPIAKLTSAGSYSIITDPPVSSYDEEGKEVWKRELDIYGREKLELTEYKQVKEFTGETDFIPCKEIYY